MRALIWHAAPYAARLFWLALIFAALAWLGFEVYRETCGALDWAFALKVLAAIGIVAAVCTGLCAASIRAYRKSSPPSPYL